MTTSANPSPTPDQTIISSPTPSDKVSFHSTEENPPRLSTHSNLAISKSAEAEGGEATSGGNREIKSENEKQEFNGNVQGHLSGLWLYIVYSAMLLSVFLVALDQTILSPALPVIASKFNSLDNIGWIASAFFLTQAPSMLIYGKALTIARTKFIFMVAIGLFEIGSLVCAVAKSVDILIFGRAFAGVGAGGIFVSVLNIITQIAPIEKRPVLMGGFGGIWGLASVVGPLIGGVFTQRVSWRWCFYINLPIGAITIVVVLFGLKPFPSPAELDPNDHRTVFQKWIQLDWVGGILLLGIVSCLVLALSWGGIQRPWNSPSVIVPFVVFGVFIPVLIAWFWYKGDKALMPLRFFKNRTLVGCIILAFFIFLAMLSLIYYLPLQYQAVKHVSPSRSGVDILPFMLSVVAGSIIGGVFVQMTGYYWPLMIFPPAILVPIGAGLFWTVTAETSNGALAGYQFIIGLGIGLAMQQGFLAVQAEFHASSKDLPQATAILSFFQLISGVVGLSISQNLFIGGLKTQLKPYNLPSETILAITGSVEVIWGLPADIQKAVIDAYVIALHHVYIIAVPVGILSGVSALLVKRHNIKAIGGVEMGGAA